LHADSASLIAQLTSDKFPAFLIKLFRGFVRKHDCARRRYPCCLALRSKDTHIHSQESFPDFTVSEQRKRALSSARNLPGARDSVQLKEVFFELLGPFMHPA